MSFDSKLLDALAMAFVEAAIQALETQVSAGTAAPGTTMYWQRELCSGGVLNAAPVTPNFESLSTIRDADLSIPRSSVCPLQRTT